MRLNKGLTPYPVLSSMDDDYVRGSFRAEVQKDITFGQLKLSIDYMLDDPGLQRLLTQGKVSYVTHVECSLVGYRQIFSSKNAHEDVTIDAGNLTNEVEISTYIVATENIQGYHNEQFNVGFGKDASFDIWKGGILAIGPEYTIDINRDGKNYDKMADILAIAVDEGNPGDVWVDTEGDCLRLFVSRDLFNVYHRHKASDRYMMIQTFFVPAIMEVLMDMKEVDKDSDEGMDSYRWYGVFKKLLEQNGIDIEDIQLGTGSSKKNVGRLAQQIFKYPLLHAMDELERAERDGGDDE